MHSQTHRTHHSQSHEAEKLETWRSPNNHQLLSWQELEETQAHQTEREHKPQEQRHNRIQWNRGSKKVGTKRYHGLRMIEGAIVEEITNKFSTLIQLIDAGVASKTWTNWSAQKFLRSKFRVPTRKNQMRQVNHTRTPHSFIGQRNSSRRVGKSWTNWRRKFSTYSWQNVYRRLNKSQEQRDTTKSKDKQARFLLSLSFLYRIEDRCWHQSYSTQLAFEKDEPRWE